jgi:predicted component of type VI protein secretion system
MNRILSFFLFCIVAITAFFVACNKSKEDQTQLTIRLTDSPFNASEVNVDIQQVRVNFREDSTG